MWTTDDTVLGIIQWGKKKFKYLIGYRTSVVHELILNGDGVANEQMTLGSWALFSASFCRLMGAAETLRAMSVSLDKNDRDSSGSDALQIPGPNLKMLKSVKVLLFYITNRQRCSLPGISTLVHSSYVAQFKKWASLFFFYR